MPTVLRGNWFANHMREIDESLVVREHILMVNSEGETLFDSTESDANNVYGYMWGLIPDGHSKLE